MSCNDVTHSESAPVKQLKTLILQLVLWTKVFKTFPTYTQCSLDITLRGRSGVTILCHDGLRVEQRGTLFTLNFHHSIMAHQPYQTSSARQCRITCDSGLDLAAATERAWFRGNTNSRAFKCCEKIKREHCCGM